MSAKRLSENVTNGIIASTISVKECLKRLEFFAMQSSTWKWLATSVLSIATMICTPLAATAGWGWGRVNSAGCAGGTCGTSAQTCGGQTSGCTARGYTAPAPVLVSQAAASPAVASYTSPAPTYPAYANTIAPGVTYYSAPTQTASPNYYSAPATPRPAPSATYTCPMHPSVVSRGPGSCPYCGMALSPR